MSSPLTGIRVLDFTRVLAGPFCTMLLGDMGAEVIKVENPDGGDETRQWGPPWSGEGERRLSAYYLGVNRNKYALTLNLKTEAGRDIARRLAVQSDIVIENFRVGQMAAFGLGYDDLRALNPRLIYCSISGFGQDGSYASRPGYDFVIQAMSGLMSITGPADGAPHKVGVAVSDVFTGLFALSSILAALRHAEATGQGQFLDVPLLDSQIAALVNVASNYLISGQVPRRLGNEHPNIVPYQVFTAADGDFVVAVGNDRQFALLCQLIEHPEWSVDPRFSTNPARLHHRGELIGVLSSAFQTRPVSDWIEGLLAVGIPAGPINDVAAILNDPHVRARGLIQEIADEDKRVIPLVGHPVHFSGTPAEVRLPPPALGQHTDELLARLLKLSTGEIAALRDAGVI